MVTIALKQTVKQLIWKALYWSEPGARLSLGRTCHSEIAFSVLLLECDTTQGNGVLYDHVDDPARSGRLFGVFIRLVRTDKTETTTNVA
jgi:hypothetical protein